MISVIPSAAAEQLRMRQEEEERMTGYSKSDLAHDWEFKILRSGFKGFSNPEVFKKAIAEEAQAGWILVEMFDDYRLRFKRKTSERKQDANRSINPYRAIYDKPTTKDILPVLVVIIGITIAVLGLAVILETL